MARRRRRSCRSALGDPLHDASAADRARRANIPTSFSGRGMWTRLESPACMQSPAVVGRNMSSSIETELAPHDFRTADEIGVAGMRDRLGLHCRWRSISVLQHDMVEADDDDPIRRAGRFERDPRRGRRRRSGRSASLISSTIPISSRFAHSSASASVGIFVPAKRAIETRSCVEATGFVQRSDRLRSRVRRWCGRPSGHAG